jgi:hypothetical protein
MLKEQAFDEHSLSAMQVPTRMEADLAPIAAELSGAQAR